MYHRGVGTFGDLCHCGERIRRRLHLTVVQRLIVGLLAVLAVAASQTSTQKRLLLGTAAPPITPSGKEMVVLLFGPEPGLGSDLREPGIRTVHVTGEQTARVFGYESGRMAVLLDDRGIIRRVIRRDDDAERFTAVVRAEIRAWQEGRQVFASHCARCHGPDGQDDSYPGVKSLAGIGNRLTEAQILEKTSRTGAVDLTALGDRTRFLAVYVAGL